MARRWLQPRVAHQGVPCIAAGPFSPHRCDSPSPHRPYSCGRGPALLCLRQCTHHARDHDRTALSYWYVDRMNRPTSHRAIPGIVGKSPSSIPVLLATSPTDPTGRQRTSHVQRKFPPPHPHDADKPRVWQSGPRIDDEQTCPPCPEPASHRFVRLGPVNAEPESHEHVAGVSLSRTKDEPQSHQRARLSLSLIHIRSGKVGLISDSARVKN